MTFECEGFGPQLLGRRDNCGFSRLFHSLFSLLIHHSSLFSRMLTSFFYANSKDGNRKQHDGNRPSCKFRRVLYNQPSNICKFCLLASTSKLFISLITPRISPLQTINHFFTQVHQQESKDSVTPILTLVHNLSVKHWGPTKELRVTDNSDKIF
jgi:hypothetical protein